MDFAKFFAEMFVKYLQKFIKEEITYLEELIMNKFQEIMKAVSENTVATNKVVASVFDCIQATQLNSAKIQELLEKIKISNISEEEVSELIRLSSENTAKLETASMQLTSVSESLVQTNPMQDSPVEPQPIEDITEEPGTEVTEPPVNPEDIVIEESEFGVDGSVNIDAI